MKKSILWFVPALSLLSVIVCAEESASLKASAAEKSRLKNGSFQELDDKGNPKSWKLKDAEAVKKDGKTVLLIHKNGQASQSIWDWKGPLGQSPEPRSIRIHIRASGNGKLHVAASAYTDDWSGGKLKRKFHGSEKIELIKLKPEAEEYVLHYTIKPDQWIGLFLTSFNGDAEIENVSVIKE